MLVEETLTRMGSQLLKAGILTGPVLLCKATAWISWRPWRALSVAVLSLTSAGCQKDTCKWLGFCYRMIVGL